MFSIGQDVICGNKGVCTIEDITTLDISGVDKAKKYYILKPRYVTASTVYVPVDSAATSMRTILTKEEAESLISSIPEISVLDIKNEKLVEQEYKACMKTNSCDEWVRLIKTIYERKQKRLQAGRKETAVDSKYFKIAEDNLYGELAVALEMERSQICDYISAQLQGFSTV
ncbi:MAG: CarD family transcriptional regulator [Lachnospiraceae bacterium]|nr:CarD family transcriptional regulator [Lachnospiraceae bacterium]